MISLLLFTLSTCFLLVTSQTENEKAKYEKFAELCDIYGYTWESHIAVTEDGWELTLLRLTGLVNGKLDVEKKKIPILYQHDIFADAELELNSSDVGEPWIFLLFNRGYDIWLANSRGTKYSDVN